MQERSARADDRNRPRVASRYLPVPMPETLTVRNVPAALRERLQRRAAAHERSLDAEVVALLEGAVASASDDAPDSEKRESVIERIDRLRESGPVIHDSPAEVKRKMREGLA